MPFTEWFLVRCTASLGYAQGIASKMMEKKKESWVNPEAELMYYCWTSAMENTELDDDHRSLLGAARDIGLLIIDEDSHYLLRMLYGLEKLFELKERISIIPLTTPLERNHAGGQLLWNESNEWQITHRLLKGLLLPLLGIAAIGIKLKARKKPETEEARVLDECFKIVMDMDENLRKKGRDHIRSAYSTIRDIAVVMSDRDEQTRNFTRRLLSEIIAREPMFRIEMHAHKPYWKSEYICLIEKERILAMGMPIEPDALALGQDIRRYKREAEEELKSLYAQREKDKQ